MVGVGGWQVVPLLLLVVLSTACAVVDIVVAMYGIVVAVVGIC